MAEEISPSSYPQAIEELQIHLPKLLNIHAIVSYQHEGRYGPDVRFRLFHHRAAVGSVGGGSGEEVVVWMTVKEITYSKWEPKFSEPNS